MATEQYFSQVLSHAHSLKKDEVSLQNWEPNLDSTNATENNQSDGFDCNICLDSVQDPVITLCGHLYCWPCIYKWIHHQTISSNENQQPQCPVCKSLVSQQTLVPLYGRSQTAKASDDSDKDLAIPKRPSSPRCGAHTSVPSSPTATMNPAQLLRHRGYEQVDQAGGYANVVNPTMGVFGEAVYARVFGNGETMTTLYSYPNTVDLVGSISSPRLRRHVMETDKSLSRLSFFLCCCIVLCLFLF